MTEYPRRVFVGLFIISASTLSWSRSCFASAALTPADVVRSVLAVPDERLNYERAKLAFDRILSPDLDERKISQEVDRIASATRAIAASETDVDKLKAIRQVLYDPGSWNSEEPFIYDQEDPFGRNIRNKLLSTYLSTKRGNCVSMPELHLIVAERLGLNVSLSTAPIHMLLRYTNPNNGHSLPIEATSGGYLTREAWYRTKMGITDAQIASGIYLGILSKRQSIAHMATTVMEWLMTESRYADAIDVADIILANFTKDVHALLTKAQAYGQLLRTEFIERFPTPSSIPSSLQGRYQMLAAENARAFATAESWGWLSPE